MVNGISGIKQNVHVLEEVIINYIRNIPENKNLINPSELKEQLDDNPVKYLILDIRKQEDYKKGHILGAINIPYGPEVAMNLENIRAVAGNKIVVVTCYIGQTSCQTISLFNIAGIKSLGLSLGMGKEDFSDFSHGWMHMGYPVDLENTFLDEFVKLTIPNQIVNQAVKDYFVPLPGHEYKIAPVALKNDLSLNPEKYLLVDIRDEQDFKTGHIRGSINIPFGLKIVENLNWLRETSLDNIIVFYCYDAQIAGQVVSLLSLIGINARNLIFGFGKDGYTKGWRTMGDEYMIEK